MKTIGLIGGMSWESSNLYYRIINELVRERLGGKHSSKCLMYSVDFAEIEKLQRDGQWDEVSRIIVDAGKRLENGGADCLVICANTIHKIAKDIEKNIQIPLIHIGDVTGKRMQQSNVKKVGLLGSRYIMEQDFYKDRITAKYGIEVIIPLKEDRDIIHSIIYSELVLGIITDRSRQKYMDIMQKLYEQGVEGIVLGCTEIPLLIGQEDSPVPVFDTTRIHAEAAVDFSLDRIE